MKLSCLSEAELVAAIRRDFPGAGGRGGIGIGDDTAVLSLGRARMLMTTDLLVEEVDFKRSFHPPFFLGRKSLNVSLSDIAAMGGRPLYALLGLALPRTAGRRWVEEYFRGFRSAAKEEGVQLVGGDLSGASKIMISVAVVGRAGRVVTRRGAKPGDFLFVSGTLGDAAGGLGILRREPERSATLRPRRSGQRGSERSASRLLRAFLDPRPRLALGRELARRRLAAAMIDLSDGLSVDLGHICRESRVGAEVWADSLPVSAELKNVSPSPLEQALHGGEDFELLFSVRPNKLGELLRLGRRFPLYPVGRIVPGRKLILVGPGGRRFPLPSRGWKHFP